MTHSKPNQKPDLDDYLALFERFGIDSRSLLSEPADDSNSFLFEKLVRELVKGSPFNAGLPEPFRKTAFDWVAGDKATKEHMGNPTHCALMLSDVLDYLRLCRMVNKA
ncbi:MAG: hypothetical protein ACPGNT_09855 [Rhodospirillales bacterium]